MRLIKVGMLCGQMTCLLLYAYTGAMAEDPPQDKPRRGQPVGTPGGIRTPATSAGIIDRSVMLTTAHERQDTGDAVPVNPFGLPEAPGGDPGTTSDHITQAVDRVLGSGFPPFLFVSRPSSGQDQAKNLRLVRHFAPQDYTRSASVDRDFLQYIKDRLGEVGRGNLKDILLRSSDSLKKEKTTAVVNREVLRLQAIYEVLKSDFLDTKYSYKSQIVNLEEQVRVVGEQNYFATNVHYGNAKLRSDVSAQYTTGSRASFGFAVHYDLNGYSYNGIKQPSTLETLASDNFQKTAKLLVGRKQEDARLVRYLLSPQAGLTFDYRHLYGTGDLYSVGLSTSLLSPLTPSRPRSQAIYSSVGIRYSWLEQNVGTETPIKGLGFSAVFAWQDNSPSYRNNTLAYGREVATTSLDRWHRRIGIEFAQRNAIVQGDYGALFLRLRDRGKGEYTLLIGSEANGVGFIGFNASTYFAW